MFGETVQTTRHSEHHDTATACVGRPFKAPILLLVSQEVGMRQLWERGVSGFRVI